MILDDGIEMDFLGRVQSIHAIFELLLTTVRGLNWDEPLLVPLKLQLSCRSTGNWELPYGSARTSVT